MTEAEALSEVRIEMEAVEGALTATLERRPRDLRIDLAAGRLEKTYLLRLYATFEGLLRTRLGLPDNDKSGLANVIQQIADGLTTWDPAKPEIQVTWWELFTRDRNLLAHGNLKPPALSLNVTGQQMESFLSLFPP
jgi:hypothetical protein